MSTTTIAPPTTGPWLRNPVTGELCHVELDGTTTEGRRAAMRVWLQPGAALPLPHRHPTLIERFTVVRGTVALVVDGCEHEALAGDPRIDVPAGAVHDWWNAGDDIAEVLVEVDATDEAPGRPAERFLTMIEAMWSLGALGRTNAAGAPRLPWLLALAAEFTDVVRTAQLPEVVCRAVADPLGRWSEHRGHDPLGPDLVGPGAACRIDDPGDDGPDALLRERVAARAARGR